MSSILTFHNHELGIIPLVCRIFDTEVTFFFFPQRTSVHNHTHIHVALCTDGYVHSLDGGFQSICKYITKAHGAQSMYIMII